VGIDTLAAPKNGLLKLTFVAVVCLASGQRVVGQSIQFPWSGFAHTPQHGCVSMVPSQPLNRILWSMQVGTGEDNHFTPPVVTRSNTVIFPMTTTNGVFRIEALTGANGQTNWEQPTDFATGGYLCPVALTPKNRLYFGGAGGTVFYCDSPDATTSPTFVRTAFYGLEQYLSKSNRFNAQVFICTPITTDRYGDIFFGFQSLSPSPLGTHQGGLARIDFDGTGSWINAPNATRSTNATEPVLNCAPALSLDEKTVYMAFSSDAQSWLVAMDSRTLAPLSSASLIDPETQSYANLTMYASTASPTIGPDGDVYFGTYSSANGDRGWLLHFNSSLSVSKIPGLFGWDVTDSIVNSSLVPSYQGNSSYLLAAKYNNYTTGQHRMAILDPQQGVRDSQSRVTVMAEVITILSPTHFYANRLYEWCINSAAVDPFTKSVLANNEDGNLYRWDLTSNQLTESIALTTSDTGEAYTPTVIGVDGIVYAINNGNLFAVGK
jgi:hypothetical protein